VARLHIIITTAQKVTRQQSKATAQHHAIAMGTERTVESKLPRVTKGDCTVSAAAIVNTGSRMRNN
jgi:hypothetical protein